MNILITGVDGFVGTALWNYLNTHKFLLKISSPIKVFGIDVRLRSSAPYLWVCDLNSPLKFKKILKQTKPDIIFHLAGGRPVATDAVWRANFVLTKNILDVVKVSKGISPCLIIPGSAAEYGQMKMLREPVTENVHARPLGWYGFVKNMQTNLGLMYARQGLNVRIARIFNVCGQGTPTSLAIGDFAQKIVQIEKDKMPPVLKVGRLSGQRDFVDIEDVVSALWAVAQKGKSGEVYNVCSEKLLSMRLLLQRLISYSRVKNIAIKEEQKAHSLTFDIVGSNAKITQATGWRPRVSLEQSLRNTLQYYRQQ